MATTPTQDELRTRRVDSVDRRVVRSRTRLVAAYRELLDDGGVEPITVTAVVQRAGVTRSTFYAHFTGVGGLAASALTEFGDAIVTVAREAVRGGGSKSQINERVLRDLAGFLHHRRDIYGPLLRDPEFAAAFTEEMRQQNLATLRTRTHLHSDPEVTARYMAGGLVTILSWWLQTEEGSSEELAHALIAVMPRDFRD